MGPGAERLYKGYVIQIWKWNAKTLTDGRGTASPDAERQPLINVIPLLIGVRRCEIEGDGLALLEAREISADFIVRDGATRERLIEELNIVVPGVLKTPVKLSYKEAEREVLESVPEGGLTRLTQPWHTEVPRVPRLCQPCFDGLWDRLLVASGTFKTEAPLGDSQTTPLELYGKLPIREQEWWKTEGDYSDMLNQIGVLTNRQVINEVKDAPAGGRICFKYDPVFRLDTKDDMKALLDRVTEQTGVTFKQEKRRVKVLFVEQVE